MPVIKAKWNGTCPRCRTDYPEGTMVFWEKGSAAICLNCKRRQDLEEAEPEPEHDMMGIEVDDLFKSVGIQPAKEQLRYVAPMPQTPGPVRVVDDVAEAVGYAWSPRQLAVYDAVLDPSGGSIMVDAVAGSGKTSTIMEAVRRLMRANRNQEIIVVAFNAAIAKTAQTKLRGTGVAARTFHSVWKYALEQALGKRFSTEAGNLDKDKVRRIVIDMADHEPRMFPYRSGVTKMVAAAKGAGVGVAGCVPDTNETWFQIIDRFDIEFEGTEADDLYAIECARRVLRINDNMEQANFTIDFDDMLYLSAKLGVQCRRSDWVVIDEAQDFNSIQRLLLHRMLSAEGRLLAVGDPYQSIYGFRGADFDSMDRIAEEFDCERLLLDSSYRCSKTAVRLAQVFVPHIQAAEDAVEGEERHLSRFNIHNFKPSDWVLCRNTAPIVTLAYRCIGAKVACRILGREIGDGLVTLIKKMNATSIDDLQERLSEYQAREVQKLLKKLEENKAQALMDKVEAINAAIEAMDRNPTIAALVSGIEALFAPKPEGILTFSTIHKAKGQEAEDTFILEPDLMPSSHAHTPEQIQQEYNCMYVAYTRSKRDVNFLTLQAVRDADEAIEEEVVGEVATSTPESELLQQVLGLSRAEQFKILDALSHVLFDDEPSFREDDGESALERRNDYWASQETAIDAEHGM